MKAEKRKCALLLMRDAGLFIKLKSALESAGWDAQDSEPAYDHSSMVFVDRSYHEASGGIYLKDTRFNAKKVFLAVSEQELFQILASRTNLEGEMDDIVVIRPCEEGNSLSIISAVWGEMALSTFVQKHWNRKQERRNRVLRAA